MQIVVPGLPLRQLSVLPMIRLTAHLHWLCLMKILRAQPLLHLIQGQQMPAALLLAFPQFGTNILLLQTVKFIWILLEHPTIPSLRFGQKMLQWNIEPGRL